MRLRAPRISHARHIHLNFSWTPNRRYVCHFNWDMDSYLKISSAKEHLSGSHAREKGPLINNIGIIEMIESYEND